MNKSTPRSMRKAAWEPFKESLNRAIRETVCFPAGVAIARPDWVPGEATLTVEIDVQSPLGVPDLSILASTYLYVSGATVRTVDNATWNGVWQIIGDGDSDRLIAT